MAFRFFGHVHGKQPALGQEFYSKVLPTLFIGTIIWLVSTLYFAGFLIPNPYDLVSASGYDILVFIIAFIGLWILLFIFAILRLNTVAMVLFFAIAGFTGVIHGVLLYVIGLIGIDPILAEQLFFTAVVAGVIATAGAMSLGFMYKDQITKHYCIAFLVFGLCIGVMELLVTIIFGWGDTSSILIDFIGLIYIFGVLVFDAAVLPAQVKRGYWMMAVINIFFDMIAMILKLFFFLLRLKGGQRSSSSSRSNSFKRR
jgi:hypothetical protein